MTVKIPGAIDLIFSLYLALKGPLVGGIILKLTISSDKLRMVAITSYTL